MASAIWDAKGSGHSDASSFGSLIYKTMAPNLSDLRSFVRGGLNDQVNAAESHASLTYALESDLRSYTRSMFVYLSGAISDTYSSVSDLRSFVRGSLAAQVNAAESHASLAYSSVSDLRSYARVVLADLSDKVSDIRSYMGGVIYSAIQAGGLNSAAISDIASAVWGQKWDVHSTASTFGSAFEVIISNLSQLRSVVEDAYTDATAVTANSLRDRVRTEGWILRNKMKVIDATGDVTLYKDDNATAAYTVSTGIADDGTSTVRKRIE
jgi:hypothetical protein